MNKDRFRIGKVHVSKTNPKATQEKITNAALNGMGGYICVTNMRMVCYANKKQEYAQLMHDSMMNLPDGMPLTWCGKFWGLKDIGRTSGPDLFVTMLKKGDKSLKHYLIGDTHEVLDAIVRKYNKEYGANIVGTYSPPFLDVDKFDYDCISQAIKDSGANLIWTAMTAPKQDEFNRYLQTYLPNVVSIGVGRAFRLSIGEVKQAPNWAKKMGVGGFFIRRRKWYQTGWWYLVTSFSLAKYMLQIVFNRFRGKKYYE